MKYKLPKYNGTLLAVILITIAALLSTGCELVFPPRTNEISVNLQKYVAHPSESAVFINLVDSDGNILDYDDTSGILTIPIEQFDSEKHIVGNVLLAGISVSAPEGILREITEIVILETEAKVQLHTSAADLDSAFDTLQISYRRYLTEEEILSAEYSQGVRLINVAPDKRALFNSAESRSISGSPLAVKLNIGAGITVDDKMSVRIDGEVSFTPALEIEIDIQPGKEPSLLFAIRGYTDLKATATVELTQELLNAQLLQVSYPLMQVPLTPLMIGVIPITHDIKLIAEFSGEARAGVTGGFNYSSRFRGGASLTGGNVQVISEHRGNFSPIGPILKGEVSVKAALAPEYSLSIFGIAGPNFKMVPYAKLSANLQHTPSLDSTVMDITGNITAGLESKVGGKVVFLRRTLADFNHTVFNINAGLLWSGNVVIPLPQVTTPSIEPASGNYTNTQTVSLSTTTPASTIRYTMDGSDPTSTTGIPYTGPFNVSASSTTIKARAFKLFHAPSNIVSRQYQINLPQVSIPTFSPSPGVYTSTPSVTISTATPGATIRYTINGTNPTQTTGTIYNGPINISTTSTIRAIAYKSGMANSSVQTGIFTIASTGTVTGTVVNATTGNGLPNVQVSVQSSPSYSTTTGSNGSFSLTAPSGAQTLVFSLTGFVIPSMQVSVGSGQNTAIPSSTLTASPSIPTGNIRIVLTWSAEPRDLDAHLFTPNGHHLYYANKTPSGALAHLDVDDTSGYGPETITITSLQTGTYTFFVNLFAGTGTLAGSGARVQVFDSSGLIRTLNAPSSGTGNYWRVLTIENSQVTVQNQITSTAPTPPVAANLTLSQASGTHSASSGSGSFAVSSNVSWTASSSASWISITSGSSGTSNGTVGYSVSANSSSSSRTGSITVSGGGISRTFSISQSGTTTTTRSVDITFVAGSYASETSWSITQSGSTVASGNGSGMSSGASFTTTRNLGIGSYTLTGSDSYGDGWNGGYITIKYTGGSTIVSSFTLSGGSTGSTTFTIAADTTTTTRSVDITFVAGSYASETSWSITQSGSTVASGNGSGMSSGASSTTTRNLGIGSYTLTGSDSYGDGWNGGYITIKYTGGSTIVSSFTVPNGYSSTTTFIVN